MTFVRDVVFLGMVFVSTQALAANPVQDMIDLALSNGDSEVTIPPGTYYANDTLVLNGVNNFSVFADDVTMILTERRQNINMDNCSNLLIQGLTMDMDPLPFTQATITAHASDWSWVEAQIDEGYPQDPNSTSKKVELYEGDTGLLFPNVWTAYDVPVEKLSADTVRLTGLSSRYNNKGIVPGDKVVIDCPQINPHAVVIDDSINCTFSNVTLHASTTFGFLESRCHGNQYLGVKIIPGPSPIPGGEPRMRSLNADGIHSKHATLGPRVENCTITCNGDDAIPINGDFDMLLEASGNTVIMVSKRDPEMQAGDIVRSYTRAGTLNFEAVVNTITSVSGYNQLRDDVVASSGVQNPSLYQDTYELTLSTTVSAVAGSAIYPINRVGSGFIVRNNYIFNKRARGILIKAGDGLIEGNTIEYNHMGAIVMAPELYWMEAGFSRSVRIINNRISHCGLNPSNQGTQAGVITVSAAGDGGFAPSGGHMDIEISGNRIDNCLGANILATSIDGLTIKNNVLMNTHVEVRNHGLNNGVNPNAGVSIINCSNVTLDENTVHNFGGDVYLQADNVTSLTGTNTFSIEPQSFMNFQLLHEIGAENEDDDQDEMQNLYEYFLGRNPTVVDTVDPRAWIMAGASNASFFVVSPAGGRNGVWAEVQKTTLLESADWSPIATRNGTNDWVSAAALTTLPHSTDPDLEQVEVFDPISAITTAAFYRLSLSTQPPLLEPVTYNASDDFSGVQGSNSWYYLEYDGSSYADLTWDSANNRWQASGANYPRIFAGACHPGDGLDAARKWVAPADGIITITGGVNRTNASGDGVVASIWKNNFTLWTATVLPATQTTPTGVDNISVNAGDAIYFRVNFNQTTTSDYTAWNPTIEFSPYGN